MTTHQPLPLDGTQDPEPPDLRLLLLALGGLLRDLQRTRGEVVPDEHLLRAGALRRAIHRYLDAANP